MTREIIEIKAMSLEEAKKRAMKVLDIQENQIFNIIEKVKGKSFFGLFAKEGVYEIEYTEEEIETPKEKKVEKEKTEKVEKSKFGVGRDLRKEREEKKKEAKKKELQNENNVEEKNINKEEKAKEVVERCEELLEKMGLNLKVEYVENDGKSYIINLFGEDKGIIIGKKGKTLNSFEYLINSLVKDARVDIDVEGFKQKRTETLKDLANKMALKAIKTKRVVRLNPMPPRERKIIHEIINNYPELNTFSEGRDPKRYIVIKRKKREVK